MKQALIDTDILSLFFRGDSGVVVHFSDYVDVYGKINLSIITYYEVLSGLKHRDAHKQLAAFLDFAARSNIVPLTEHSVTLSSDIYAAMRAQGTPIDDIDILVAGIALANGWMLVTHNRRHFETISGLEIADWTELPPEGA